MSKVLKNFAQDTKGATVIEYALIASFVSVLVVAGATLIGSRLSAHYFQPIANALT